MKFLMVVAILLIAPRAGAAEAFTLKETLKFEDLTKQEKKELRVSPAAELMEADANASIAKYDLDGDGKHELIILAHSSMYCGSGGCSVMVLGKEKGQYVSLLDQNLYPDGIGVTNEKKGRYHALCAVVDGEIVKGEKENTLLSEKQMVYPVGK